MSPHTLINDGNTVTDTSKQNDGTKHHEKNGSVKSQSTVMHRSLHSDPLLVTSAKGPYLYLSNGEKIYDATGGAAVACLGHGDERIREAVSRQMDAVSYCHSLFYATSATELLSQMLVESSGGEMARAFFISSGSEAVEAALKLARQFHIEAGEQDRTHFIARRQSYHGTTLGALGVGGHVARRALFEPLLSSNTSLVSPCYAYRDRGDEDDYVARLEYELEAEFQRVGPKRVAAFIAEPVVGAALGCVPPVPGYFAAMRRVCDRHGALLIMDEIMSGCGRIGPKPSPRFPEPLYAWQDPLIGITPDIMTMGKGLGGGYMPIACLLINHRVVNVLSRGTGAFSHGQTYQSHPVACSAALEVQRIIRAEGLVANVRKQGELLGRLLKEKLAFHWAIGDVRGMGLFWGIELVIDKATKEAFDPTEAVAMGIHELAMLPPYNMSIYPGSGSVDGKRGDHILLAPMYSIDESGIRHIVETTAAVIERFFRKYEK